MTRLMEALTGGCNNHTMKMSQVVPIIVVAVVAVIAVVAVVAVVVVVVVVVPFFCHHYH
jgi:flagellar basal body-associated protein FliL